MEFGYTLLCEQTPPKQLVSDAVGAEEAGFAYSCISDHYFPWIEDLGHSAYAWSVLGALAHATERLRLMTFVTCPTMRYHPAVVAQKAATMGVLSDGRFTLGVGAGENLNEHVVGRGWPSADVRHEMFRESLEIIRRLFDGGFVNYRGDHYRVDSAKIYDLPAERVPIGVAAFGERAGRIAAEFGDALVSDQPVADVVADFSSGAGRGKPVYGQLPVSYGADADEALHRAHKLWRWAVPGWKVMAELPGPKNFEANSANVRADDVASAVPHGPDVETYLNAVKTWADAGFTHLSFCQVGADRQDDFRRFASAELLPALRERYG
ncbi:TIGR03557 family F420-dependent LLM class oxidoreductase [Actinomadura rayongensis]|uniref:TIGR03557 family F420-dependent LLM class oxidoreductase n=1 Tax=Actinomadura rayongensis TaxID=1429076 RepID=A0A6I4W8Y6_9ACTN|nr:TIGR03557 family F420-dependent LLM class oxidoreductase [Actinomadura rayongensis]MXQ66021.1 TIGR03557 family F420-dependent LLM class oxidoreductase [Actinomadura rayongensis]